MKLKTNPLPLILLTIFFLTGIFTFRDFPASVDETNQIDAGHILWDRIGTGLLNREKRFENLPDLEKYFNRYYGQGAVFPTVLIEAVNGFGMDESSVLRLRHFWNFLTFFAGLCCFALVLQQQWQNYWLTCAGIGFMIFFPRIHGDIFYNDRDVLLLSWMMIGLGAHTLYQNRKRLIYAFLFGFSLAIAFTTRPFGILLLLFPSVDAIRKKKIDTKGLLIALLGFLLTAYCVTPLAWGQPVSYLKEMLSHFLSGKQRSSETGNRAETLFMGKMVPESDVPFSYLPVWIFCTTPLITTLFSLIGIVYFILRKRDSLGMTMFLWLILTFVFTGFSHIQIYNGWRHCYYLVLPILWFAVEGVAMTRKRFAFPAAALLCLSWGMTAAWMIQAHPYESVYFNPLFREKAAENFDRDYWRISSTECLRRILDADDGELIQVGEYNGSLENIMVGLFPKERERLYIRPYFSYHREPISYLIFNYSNFIGNEKEIPLYEPLYSVCQDGFKLAEVFKREDPIIPFITRIEMNSEPIPEIADGVYETAWRSECSQNGEERIVIELEKPYELRGLSLLPGDDEREYARSLEIAVSENGEDWEVIPSETVGLLDTVFEPITTKYLRLRNTELSDVNWSIREIYFYGEEAGTYSS